MDILTVENVVAGYGAANQVLKEVGLRVEEQEVVTIIGPNGAGKSTLLKTIAGLLTPTKGTIHFRNTEIAGWAPREVCASGIAYVPQEHNVFPSLTLKENLEMAAYLLRGDQLAKLDAIFTQFPDIAKKRHHPARTLSGGQRQTLALAMALMAEPSLLLLDEPSAGLSPRAAELMFDVLHSIRASGVSITMVEQNALASLNFADRGYILVDGRNGYEGAATALRDDPEIRQIFLGA